MSYDTPPVSWHSDGQSTDITLLCKAMVAAAANIKHPVRNAVNPHFRSKYADLTAVIDAFRPAYTAAGLIVTQLVIDGRLVTMVAHTSGQWLRYSTAVKPERGTVQALGSALTYMRRYTLQALVGIAADDDDDGNAATETAKPKPAPKKAPAKRKEEAKPWDWRADIAKASDLETLDDLRTALKDLEGKERDEALVLFKSRRDHLEATS